MGEWRKHYNDFRLGLTQGKVHVNIVEHYNVHIVLYWAATVANQKHYLFLLEVSFNFISPRCFFQHAVQPSVFVGCKYQNTHLKYLKGESTVPSPA